MAKKDKDFTKLEIELYESLSEIKGEYKKAFTHFHNYFMKTMGNATNPEGLKELENFIEKFKYLNEILKKAKIPKRFHILNELK